MVVEHLAAIATGQILPLYMIPLHGGAVTHQTKMFKRANG